MKEEHKNKKTLVFGASTKSERYSNIAIRMLQDNNIEVEAIGGRASETHGIPIQTGHPPLSNIDTITMYMGAERQKEHIDYLLSLKPKRIIFNPGAENPVLAQRAKEVGIEPIQACTLVMLRTGQY